MLEELKGKEISIQTSSFTTDNLKGKVLEVGDSWIKIQLDSLALSMGVGFVGGFSYSLLATAKFIADAEASDVLLLMALTYMAGVIIGQIRYR